MIRYAYVVLWLSHRLVGPGVWFSHLACTRFGIVLALSLFHCQENVRKMHEFGMNQNQNDCFRPGSNWGPSCKACKADVITATPRKLGNFEQHRNGMEHEHRLKRRWRWRWQYPDWAWSVVCCVWLSLSLVWWLRDLILMLLHTINALVRLIHQVVYYDYRAAKVTNQKDKARQKTK